MKREDNIKVGLHERIYNMWFGFKWFWMGLWTFGTTGGIRW